MSKKAIFLKGILILLILRSNAQSVNFYSKEKNLHYYYHDSIGWGHPLSFSEENSKKIVKSSIWLIEADKNQTPYLIHPDESVSIIKDNQKFSILSIVDNEERNHELLFFKELIKKTGQIRAIVETPMYQQSAESLNELKEREKDIEKIRVSRISFLDSFTNKLPVSKAYKEFANNVIKITAIRDTICLYLNNVSLLKKEKLLDSYSNRLIDEVNTLPYIPFLPYVETVLKSLQLIMEGKSSGMVNVSSEMELKTSFDSAENRYKGMARNLVLARILYSALYNNINIPSTYSSLFIQTCTDSNYCRLVLNMMKEKSVHQRFKGNDKLISLSGDTTDLKMVLSGYKGSAIYLDIWASWCAPCREEFPFYKQVKEKMKGKKIVFISVSIDKNMDDWKKGCLEENMTSNNFLLLGDAATIFNKKYQIGSIPRFILLDKNGRIIDMNALRPSDPKLISLLDKVLKG